MKIIKKILDLFYGKTVREQKEDYIKKHGYPEETVQFGDSQGRLGWIIGKRVLRETINHPTMKRIAKEIDEYGVSCPNRWKIEITD